MQSSGVAQQNSRLERTTRARDIRNATLTLNDGVTPALPRTSWADVALPTPSAEPTATAGSGEDQWSMGPSSRARARPRVGQVSGFSSVFGKRPRKRLFTSRHDE